MAATVEVDIGGGNIITSSIIPGADAELALDQGSEAAVIIKAPDVILAT